MKSTFTFLVFAILASSCQVSETIYFNEDGSGKVEVVELRDEYSYMQIAGLIIPKKKSTSTHPTFSEVVLNTTTRFLKFTKPEQELFITYNDVNVHIKSSYDKEFRTVITQSFDK
jgi:hypothetical protein